MNETILIWTVAAIVTTTLMWAYVVRLRRRVHNDTTRKREAAELGIDQPLTQAPYVDPGQCVGCGACVAACPEGDVLGIVGGTAVVINGLRCFGHGRCEQACPVGAIEVGLGDLKSRIDVPMLDERYESSVPGVFVVGEIGGMSLVRNAIAQGGIAGSEIAERVRASSNGEGRLDVAVVGAGPSGLATGAVLAQAGIRHVVLERESSLGGSLLHYPRRKMVLSRPVPLPGGGALDRDSYGKEGLLERLEQLVRESGTSIRFDAGVSGITREEDGFALDTAAGPVNARYVVFAVGRRGTPRKLGIPGEALPKVMYHLVDAASYEGERILVVGGGDSAVEAAIGLARQDSNDVTLSYRRRSIVRVSQRNRDAFHQAVQSERVRALFSSELVRIGPTSVTLRVHDGGSEQTVELDNDYVFIFAGGVPPFGLLRSLGLRFGGESETPEALTA